jgi:hypothetical protein
MADPLTDPQPGDNDQPQTPTADRRGGDRRKSVVDQRTDGGFERRRGPGRRRSDFVKSADEGELTDEQFLFVKAVDAYKRTNQRPYPTWTEVLEVIRKLGYRKTAPMCVDLPAAQDWTEPADAPAFAERRTDTPTEDDTPVDEDAAAALTDEWAGDDA